jgi:hypothetical protein
MSHGREPLLAPRPRILEVVGEYQEGDKVTEALLCPCCQRHQSRPGRNLLVNRLHVCARCGELCNCEGCRWEAGLGMTGDWAPLGEDEPFT